MAGGFSVEEIRDAMQQLRDVVRTKREKVVNMWQDPPPPVMLAYGATVLVSGVLMASMGNWSNLKMPRGGGGLEILMELMVNSDGLSG